MLTLSRARAQVGAELTGNPLVRKVAFTGSTTVGKNLMKNASETVKEACGRGRARLRFHRLD